MSLPPKIYDENGRASFGGSQMWLPDPMLLNSGCGIIAGLDAITRLKGEEGMTRKEYFDRFFEAKDYIRPITIGKNREARKVFGKEFLGSLGVSAGRFRRGIRKLAVKEGLNIRVKPFLFKELRTVSLLRGSALTKFSVDPVYVRRHDQVRLIKLLYPSCILKNDPAPALFKALYRKVQIAGSLIRIDIRRSHGACNYKRDIK